MLKEADELIDLNDDSLDNLITFNNAGTTTNQQTSVETIKSPDQELKVEINGFLNEEIDTRNLPASPPFTKVSSIKMYKTPMKTEGSGYKPNKSTPLIKVRGAIAGKPDWKDPTKSFLPRIIKKRHQ